MNERNGRGEFFGFLKVIQGDGQKSLGGLKISSVLDL
jgi:hypothetical protein